MAEEDRGLFPPGFWYEPGAMTVARRGDAIAVHIPRVPARVLDATWDLLGDDERPLEDLLGELVDVFGYQRPGSLPPILLVRVRDGAADVLVRGKSVLGVYSTGADELILGSPLNKPPTETGRADVVRVAWGTVPEENGEGILRMSEGIVRAKGFALQLSDPARMSEDQRGRLAAGVHKHGTNLEAQAPWYVPPKPTAERPAAGSSASSAPAAASGGPSPSASSAEPAPAEPSAAPLRDAPETASGASAIDRLFATPLPAEQPDPAAADEPAAPAPEPPPAAEPEPAPEPATPRRRLISSSLFGAPERTGTTSAASSDAGEAPVPEAGPEAASPLAPDLERTQIPQQDDERAVEDTILPPAEAPVAPPAAAGSDVEEISRGYDDLFGETIVRRVEDAAVRPGGADPDGPAPAPQPPAAEPGPEPRRPAPEPEAPASPSSVPSPAPQPEAASNAEATSGTEAAPSGFIDWVPGVTSAATAPTAPPPVAQQPAPATDPAQQPATPAAQQPEPAGGGDTPAGLGDHDGSTRVWQRPRPADPQGRASASGASALPSSKQVITLTGVECRHGHVNPPQRSDCRICGETLSGPPRQLPRPDLGVVEISTGGELSLSRTTILGRKPRASRVQGDEVPQLVTVPSPDQDISRSHLQLRLEGWHVVAVDLDTTNGTGLYRPGADPVRMRPGDGIILRSGDVVDLGDGVTLRMRDLP